MSTVNQILGEAEATVPEYQYELVDREESDSTEDLAYAVTKMVAEGYRYFYSKWTGQDSVDMMFATKSPLDEAGVERVYQDAINSYGGNDEDDEDDEES